MSVITVTSLSWYDEVYSAQGPDPATADYTVGWREEDEKEKRFPSQIRFLIYHSAVLHR